MKYKKASLNQSLNEDLKNTVIKKIEIKLPQLKLAQNPSSNSEIHIEDNTPKPSEQSGINHFLKKFIRVALDKNKKGFKSQNLCKVASKEAKKSYWWPSQPKVSGSFMTPQKLVMNYLA